MAQYQGYFLPRLKAGASLFKAGLVTYRSSRWRVVAPLKIYGARFIGRAETDVTRQSSGYIMPNFYLDLYKRVVLIPATVNLGAISTEQSFEIHLWNAHRKPVSLQRIDIQDGDGITLTGDNPPLTLPALGLKRYRVKVGMNGGASIDCRIVFYLSDGTAQLHITGSRSTDWAFAPDWGDNVTENLEFLTRVHQSVTGAEQRIARRLSPRRTFEFKVALSAVERQAFESAIYAYGARVWSLPIYTDATRLAQSITAGKAEIHLDTTGRDFSEQGRALLVAGTQKEMVEITAIAPDKLTLKRAIVGDFDRAFTLIYPLRSAVLTDMPIVTRLSDGAATAQVRLKINEHNGGQADIVHLPTYRNHPVLEPTSEWSEDITAQYTRLIKTLDNETGVPFYLDTANKAFQLTNHRFVLSDRDMQRRLRNLFYHLRGRQRAIWVATSATDVTPAGDLLGKALDIAFINYTAALQKQTGRQDVRIECTDGRIFYRRIVSAVVVDSDTERLALDGETLHIKQGEILKISFLTLSRLDSDTVSWVHHTDADGVATVSVSFRGLRDELEI